MQKLARHVIRSISQAAYVRGHSIKSPRELEAIKRGVSLGNIRREMTPDDRQAIIRVARAAEARAATGEEQTNPSEEFITL